MRPAIIAFGLSAACAGGGGGTTAVPPPPPPPIVMTAAFLTVPWTAVTGIQATRNGNALTIAGTDVNGVQISVSLPNVVGPSEYTIGSPVTNVGLVTIGAAQWSNESSGGSGSVTITGISSSSVSGTFSFDLMPVPNTGASGLKFVRNGVFYLTF